MKTTNKGIRGLLAIDGEWAKHLRPDGKRAFWRVERTRQKESIAKEIKENDE